MNPTPNDIPWIDWHGGECPVPGETAVEVRCRDGNTETGYKAESYYWDHKPGDKIADIIAYRVLVQAQVAELRAELSNTKANLAHADEKIAELQDFIRDAATSKPQP